MRVQEASSGLASPIQLKHGAATVMCWICDAHRGSGRGLWVILPPPLVAAFKMLPKRVEFEAVLEPRGKLFVVPKALRVYPPPLDRGDRLHDIVELWNGPALHGKGQPKAALWVHHKNPLTEF